MIQFSWTKGVHVFKHVQSQGEPSMLRSVRVDRHLHKTTKLAFNGMYSKFSRKPVKGSTEIVRTFVITETIPKIFEVRRKIK